MRIPIRSRAPLVLALLVGIGLGAFMAHQIHEAANRTSKPVVIYLATLLKKGAPAATPVTVPGS